MSLNSQLTINVCIFLQTGNAMKQREINMILSKNAATSFDGESSINLRILDVDLPEIQGKNLPSLIFVRIEYM